MDLGAQVAHDAAGVAERFGESGLLGLEVGASTGSLKLAIIFAKFFAIFFLLHGFFEVFASFSKFSDVFGPVWIRSDLFAHIRTHSDGF